MVAYGRRRAVVPYRGRTRPYTASFGAYRAIADAIRRTGAQRMLRRWRPQPLSVRRPAVKRSRSGSTVRRAIRPRVAGPRFNTRGYPGSRFRKPKTQNASVYAKYGYIEHVEKGGVQSSNNCVYVGHTFGWEKVLYAVLAGIVRKMATHAGYTMRAITDKVQENEVIAPTVSPFNVNISFKNNPTDVQAVSSIIVPANSRWEDVVALFVTEMKTLASGVEDIIFLRLWLSPRDSAGDTNQVKRSAFDLGSLLLDVYCTSVMTMQNRTLARTGTGDESNMLDVANNPVAGRCYYGNGNGALLRVDNNSAVKTESFLGNDQSGAITYNPDLGGGANTDEIRKVLNRPPTKAAFTNVSKVSSAYLKPGEMKKSILTYRRKMYFQTFINSIFKNLDLAVNSNLTPLGNFKVYGFEKQCNTGVDEPLISIGYEINSVYRCNVNEIHRGINVVQTQL